MFLPLAAFAAVSVPQDSSEAEMLQLGHRAYVARFQSAPDRTGAEERFAWALGKRNTIEINRSSKKVHLEELQMWIANITKGACRVGDFSHGTEELRFLRNRKATTLANITIDGFIKASPPDQTLAQSQVWDTYRRGLEFHKNSLDAVAAYQYQGGYGPDKHLIAYEGVGIHIKSLFKAVASSPIGERQQAFYHCNRMLLLTMGEDPMGY